MIKIGLVDDHAIVRMGFRLLLQATDDCTVVFETDRGEGALALLATQPVDVVVLDLSMPGLGGLEALKRIRLKHETLRVLVLSAHDDVVHVKRAMDAGAQGFLSKGSAPEKLIEALRHLHRGQVFLEPAVSEQLLLASISGDTASPVARLSEREFEVFIRLAKGASVAQIANELNVSASTAGTHLYHVKQKLNASNQAELTLMALRHGLLQG
jgi:two-component system, NarL family, invasion response regulator UvrY